MDACKFLQPSLADHYERHRYPNGDTDLRKDISALNRYTNK